MPKSPESLLAAFAAVARPLMLQMTLPEFHTADCIGATRMSCWALEALGLKAVPHAVTWVVQASSLQFAFVCGLRGPAKSAALASTRNYSIREIPGGGPSWDGHLVLIAEDRWLIDPSFDQCAAHPELDIPPTVLVIDLGDPKAHPDSWVHPRDAQVKATFVTDNGVSFSTTYQPLDGEDEAWKGSEAWNQPEWELAGLYIAQAVLGYKPT